jgi:hypothetical protein
VNHQVLVNSNSLCISVINKRYFKQFKTVSAETTHIYKTDLIQFSYVNKYFNDSFHLLLKHCTLRSICLVPESNIILT